MKKDESISIKVDCIFQRNREIWRDICLDFEEIGEEQSLTSLSEKKTRQHLQDLSMSRKGLPLLVSVLFGRYGMRIVLGNIYIYQEGMRKPYVARPKNKVHYVDRVRTDLGLFYLAKLF